MSAWQLVNAWNGFHADAVDETLTFAPKASGDLRLFWSSETAWGDSSGRAAGGASPCGMGTPICVRSPSTAVLSPRARSQRVKRWSSSDGTYRPTAVRKSFQSLEVVHGIDLTIEDDSFTVFVGPSGCSKPTLLRVMAGREMVLADEVTIDGAGCE